MGKRKPTKVKPRVGKLVKTERGSILSFLDTPNSPPSSSSSSSSVLPPSNPPTLSPDQMPLSPSCVLLSSSPSLSPAFADPLSVHSSGKLSRKGSTFSSALLNSSLNNSLNMEKMGAQGSQDYLNMDVWESQGSQEERGREERGW